jgi:hypothetical protein
MLEGYTKPDIPKSDIPPRVGLEKLLAAGRVRRLKRLGVLVDIPFPVE